MTVEPPGWSAQSKSAAVKGFDEAFCSEGIELTRVPNVGETAAAAKVGTRGVRTTFHPE